MLRGLNLNLFDPFKDVKDGQLLDEDGIAALDVSDGVEGDGPMFRLFFWGRIGLVILTMLLYFNALALFPLL